MAAPEFTIESDPSPEHIRYLDDRLYELNAAATGIDDGAYVAVFVRAEDGSIIAGITGTTWGGCCEIRQVWVTASRRKQGLGSKLLDAVEAEARRRGCTQVVLTTHSFQAPALYKKRGYVQLAAVEDNPRGHSQLWLRKAL